MPRPEDPTARERILAAAGQLYYERGVHAVGIAEIVAAAGTGRNVLYRHFGGRQDLVLAYLTDTAERMDAAWEESSTDASPRASLVAVAQHVADMVSQPGYRGCPFRNYLHETRDTQDAAGQLALGRVCGLRLRLGVLAAKLDVADAERLAERIWLILEGVYAATAYPARTDIAAAGVRHVEELVVAATSHPAV